MAIANRLVVLCASGPDMGSNPASGGLTIHVPASADSTPAIRFDAQYWRTGATWASTDRLFLTAYNATTRRTVEYELTYTGNLWEYVPDSTHFDAAGIRPGSSASWTGQFQLRADTGSGAAPIIGVTDTFSLSVRRAIALSPAKFGSVVGWWDAWDLSGTSGSTSVTSWADKSGLERHLLESTNAPTYYVDAIGRPMVRFDGANDILTTAQNYAVSDYTLLAALRLRSMDGTARAFAQLGTGSGQISATYDTTNGVRATIDGSNSTIAAAPLLQQSFIAGFVFDTGVDHSAIFNTSALSVTAGGKALTAGPLKLGGTTSFSSADICEVWLFDSELSTAFSGALEDAVRALAAKWGVNY